MHSTLQLTETRLNDFKQSHYGFIILKRFELNSF